MVSDREWSRILLGHSSLVMKSLSVTFFSNCLDYKAYYFFSLPNT